MTNDTAQVECKYLRKDWPNHSFRVKSSTHWQGNDAGIIVTHPDGSETVATTTLGAHKHASQTGLHTVTE